jgi:[histone H3]-lysine4/36 N-trimethyltransferase SMYD
VISCQKITITYVEYTLPKSLRQAELSESFYFTCDCIRCIDLREAISDDLELVKNDELLKTLKALHESAASKTQVSIDDLERAAKAAESSLDILHSYTYYELMSELQRRYIDSQRWDGASKSAVAVLRFLENVCQQLWPILGLQYFMVGKIYWFREQTDLAINSLNLAFQILSMTHHGDPLLQELAQLRTEAMLELEMNRKMPGGRFSTKPQQLPLTDK